MDESGRVGGPGPTIVGPRPGGGSGSRADVPTGMERLVILAQASEWRGRVLDDPVGAAGEAGIDLTASERAILASVSRAALRRMIDGFARSGGRGWRGLAAGAGKVAAAALLATGAASTVSHGDAGPADEPAVAARDAEAPRPALPDTLRRAQAEAAKTGRPLAVFVMDDSFPMPPRMVVVFGLVTREHMEEMTESQAADLCRAAADGKNAGFRKAARGAGLITVGLRKPALADPPKPAADAPDPAEARRAFRDALKKADAYKAVLTRYDVAFLPTVLILAPDGTELLRVVQPATETDLVKPMGDVPALMEGWRAKRGPAATSRPTTRPAPPASEGMRADVPKPRH